MVESYCIWNSSQCSCSDSKYGQRCYYGQTETILIIQKVIKSNVYQHRDWTCQQSRLPCLVCSAAMKTLRKPMFSAKTIIFQPSASKNPFSTSNSKFSGCKSLFFCLNCFFAGKEHRQLTFYSVIGFQSYLDWLCKVRFSKRQFASAGYVELWTILWVPNKSDRLVNWLENVPEWSFSLSCWLAIKSFFRSVNSETNGFDCFFEFLTQ